VLSGIVDGISQARHVRNGSALAALSNHKDVPAIARADHAQHGGDRPAATVYELRYTRTPDSVISAGSCELAGRPDHARHRHPPRVLIAAGIVFLLRGSS
jgi:hypothetical protein